MQPNHYDLLGQVRNEPRRMTREDHQPLHENPLQSRSPSGAAPLRTEDSWIEVASQPSSSSLSSANDDIITTGLRVQQQGSNSHRSRSQRHFAVTMQNGYSSRDASSSQDEYEESESESDRVLSSSNEEMYRKPPSLQNNGPSPSTLDAASSDDDDNSTALGTRISTSRFVPQPNVFSHPPASRNPSWTRATDTRRPEPSEASNSSRRTAIRMNSQASMRSNRSARQNQQHSPFNMLAPSHQADHDAALRASLSTLLSCAAAARGLPKSEPQQLSPDPRQQPSSFRLVPESAMDSGDEEAPAAAERTTAGPVPRKHPISGPSYPSEAAPAPKKRRSSSPKGAGNQAASRKSRRSLLNESLSVNSPTVMTWVVSAGVVVLFSAISFSAGYMLGREVGRMEMGPGMAGNGSGTTSATCGQQAVKGGLKRFRWGSSAAGSGILA